MFTWLIVDGYNVINDWPDLNSLKEVSLHLARLRLIEILQEFSPLLWHKITIVFDAYRTEAVKESREDWDNVEVIYTKEGLTADAYIERLVYQHACPELLIEVASSDYLEQRLVLWKGGKRIPARELKERLEACKKELSKGHLRKLAPRNTLGSSLPKSTRFVLEQWRRRRS